MDTGEAVAPEADAQQAVVILGKENDFLYVAPDFDTAVYFVNQYRSGLPPDSELEERVPRLRLDELDFFDGAGHQLLLITDGEDSARGLKVTDPDITMAKVIRKRVAAVYRVGLCRYEALMAETGGTTPAPGPAGPPSAPRFVDYVVELQKDPKVMFDRKRNCCWFAWLLGRC